MIDRNTLTAEQKVFFDGVVAAGFPVDDAAFRLDMQQLADAAHLGIANPSKYSAFWSFVNAGVAAPARALIRALVTRAMPGFYVKTASGPQLELIAWAHALTRKPAATMTGYITFARASGAVGDVEIPAGVRVRTIAIAGIVYRMQTLAAATIPAGSETADVLAAAEGAGSAWNLGAGYYQILDSDVPRIGGVTNTVDYLVQPGADAEPDDELRLRIRDRFLAVGDWHTDAKYRAMIAEHSGIRPDQIFFDHSAPRGPGSADAYIIFDAGTSAAAYLDDLNSYIAAQGNHGHGDDLQCKEIPALLINLTAAVRLSPALTPEQKATALGVLEQMIRCAFRDNNAYVDAVTRAAPFSIFPLSRLAAELHAGVPELLGIAFNLPEVAAALELPRLNTLAVTEAV